MGVPGHIRTAKGLCAQALSRCPAFQIGRLLQPWSRLEAARHLLAAKNIPGSIDVTADDTTTAHEDFSAVTAPSNKISMELEKILVGERMMEASAAEWVCRFITSKGYADTEGARALAEGALRFLFLHTYRRVAGKADSVEAKPEDHDLVVRIAIDRLCLSLSVAELSAASKKQEVFDGKSGWEAGEVGNGGDSAEMFGVGAVERGVGYALAAADGSAVLRALRGVLEKSERELEDLRQRAENQGGGGSYTEVGVMAGGELPGGEWLTVGRGFDAGSLRPAFGYRF